MPVRGGNGVVLAEEAQITADLPKEATPEINSPVLARSAIHRYRRHDLQVGAADIESGQVG